LIPKKIAKLLISCPRDEKYIAYRLGQHNIYLEALRAIKTQKNEHSLVRIALIKYEDKGDINLLIQDFNLEPNSYVSRVFKTAIFSSKLKTKAFLYTAAVNLLALASGKTLRIKSMNKDLQKQFYEICLDINANKGFGVKFDFDEYDAKVELREYKEEDRTWIVIISDLSKFLD